MSLHFEPYFLHVSGGKGEVVVEFCYMSAPSVESKGQFRLPTNLAKELFEKLQEEVLSQTCKTCGNIK